MLAIPQRHQFVGALADMLVVDHDGGQRRVVLHVALQAAIGLQMYDEVACVSIPGVSNPISSRRTPLPSRNSVRNALLKS